MGEFAFQLLKRTFACEFRILVSDWLLQELEKNGLGPDKLGTLLNRLDDMGKLQTIEATDQDIREARDAAPSLKTHWHDYLHAILARKGNAEFLVTRDTKDFEGLRLIKTVLPERL